MKEFKVKRLLLALVVAVFGGVALGQTLTVLGDESLDLSPLARGKTVSLGLVNTSDSLLYITVRLKIADGVPVSIRGEPNGQIRRTILQGGGSQDYLSLNLANKVNPEGNEVALPESGYIVIEAREASQTGEPLTSIEKKFSNPKLFVLHWITWLAPFIAVGTILLAWGWSNWTRPSGSSFIRGWIAGTPKVSFTESFGSLTTSVLAFSNIALIPAIPEAVTGNYEPLQVAGLIFGLTILLGPIILKLVARQTSSDESPYLTEAEEAEGDKVEEKVRVWWFVLASIVSLTGTLLQLYVLFCWLNQIDLSFLPTFLPSNPESIPPFLRPMGWDELIVMIAAMLLVGLALLIAKRSFSTLRLREEPSKAAELVLGDNRTLLVVRQPAFRHLMRGSPTVPVTLASRPTRKRYNVLY